MIASATSARRRFCRPEPPRARSSLEANHPSTSHPQEPSRRLQRRDGANSLWLKHTLDNGRKRVVQWSGGADADWQWLTKTLPMKAGRNTVALYKREANVKVKTFELPTQGTCTVSNAATFAVRGGDHLVHLDEVLSPSNRWMASDLRP